MKIGVGGTIKHFIEKMISHKLIAGSIFSMIVLCFSLCLVLSSAENDPKHPVGSGDDDWWIAYPDQHPNASSEIDHPQWLLEALKDKPVLILVHSSGCGECIIQEKDINRALKDFHDEVDYYSIVLGQDERAYQILYAYYPSPSDRGRIYIPLTIVVTLVPNSKGEVQVGWHSYFSAKGQAHLQSYLNDAVSYYEDNSTA